MSTVRSDFWTKVSKELNGSEDFLEYIGQEIHGFEISVVCVIDPHKNLGTGKYFKEQSET